MALDDIDDHLLSLAQRRDPGSFESRDVDKQIFAAAVPRDEAVPLLWVETVEVRVGPGHKGPHVTEVLSVDSSTAVPTASRRSSATPDSPPPDIGVEETGTVKWFNSEKGYGFITRSSSGDDVFVHISALERSGLTGLSEGDRVVIEVGKGRKGLEAARVRVV